MSITVGAVDFGASSIRVCRVTFGNGAPRFEVVHRHAHAPVHDGAHLRWDWERLVAEMERGLDVALALGPLASIGVDTWGVDYGLLDHRGELVEPPISYRDGRTQGHQAVLERMGADHFFATTGLQALPIDTIFQLAAHDRAQLGRATRMLMLPELLVHHLTGVVTGEYSSASTIARGHRSSPIGSACRCRCSRRCNRQEVWWGSGAVSRCTSWVDTTPRRRCWPAGARMRRS